MPGGKTESITKARRITSRCGKLPFRYSLPLAKSGACLPPRLTSGTPGSSRNENLDGSSANRHELRPRKGKVIANRTIPKDFLLCWHFMVRINSLPIIPELPRFRPFQKLHEVFLPQSGFRMAAMPDGLIAFRKHNGLAMFYPLDFPLENALIRRID
jgi:hypothetical protein